MKKRCRAIAILMVISTLVTGCGKAEPAAIPASPTDTLIPPTATIMLPADTPEFPNLSVEVPQGTPATLDGILSPDEWNGACTKDLAGGGELLLMHDDGYLYLGIRSRTMGYGSVCIAQDNQISILHSSAALGTAVFEKDEDDWRRTRQFSWCCRSRTDNSQREAHLQQEGWSASIGYLGTPEEMEYQIAMREGTLTLAVVYQEGPNMDSALWWPKSLDDDCLGLVLLPDNPPERLRFSPEKWMTVTASTLVDSMAPAALGDTRIRPADGVTMVYVPGGTFQMGSTEAEVDAALSSCRQVYSYCNRSFYGLESPQHTVTLNGFWIDQTEVTNAQYRQCVETGVCQVTTTCDQGEPTFEDVSKTEHPVVCINWHEAQTYCEWAGARLPTEAEREYAARGPEGHVYPWGNTFDGGRLNYCDTNCEKPWADTMVDDGYTETAPVGNYPEGASWCGAQDMAGNVGEWVADWLGDYDSAPQANPTGPATGDTKVVRGNSWRFFQARFRTAARDSIAPVKRYNQVGFRCAISPGE